MASLLPVRDPVGDHLQSEGLRGLHAGGSPISWVALAVELQRDWAREETVADVIEIVLTERLLRA
jgi:hypothetical protein